MSALLLLPLLRDVGGTAQVLFVTTKQIETSVLSSGRDITTMLVVRCLLVRATSGPCLPRSVIMLLVRRRSNYIDAIDNAGLTDGLYAAVQSRDLRLRS